MGDTELEALRRHGFGVAYRMLGSVAEAEDVAQEAMLRLTRQEEEIVEEGDAGMTDDADATDAEYIEDPVEVTADVDTADEE